MKFAAAENGDRGSSYGFASSKIAAAPAKWLAQQVKELEAASNGEVPPFQVIGPTMAARAGIVERSMRERLLILVVICILRRAECGARRDERLQQTEGSDSAKYSQTDPFEKQLIGEGHCDVAERYDPGPALAVERDEGRAVLLVESREWRLELVHCIHPRAVRCTEGGRARWATERGLG